MNRKYEVMVVFDPKLTKESVIETLNKYLDMVKKSSGTIDKQTSWGLKKFAYPIKNRNEGYYEIVEFSCEVSCKNEIQRLLSLDESVLRHKLLRLED
jgi:small subunit ribosomal protein S6